MTRYMYDAIGSNAKALLPLKPTMVGIYLTGSGGINWTTAEVRLFPAGTEFIQIDQGGATSPQYEATVFDAEPHAWTIAGAIAATKKCTKPRPTIYCDRSDYQTIPSSYTGDIWLAAPGITDAQAVALATKDKRIVAVQNLWANTYDRSIVIDPFWPNKAPAPKPPVGGLPTGIAFSEFATACQINAKCNPTSGPENTYEWQLELLTLKGWEVHQQFTTSGPLATFANLEPKQHYRFRVTRGTWSDWVNVAT